RVGGAWTRDVDPHRRRAAAHRARAPRRARAGPTRGERGLGGADPDADMGDRPRSARGRVRRVGARGAGASAPRVRARATGGVNRCRAGRSTTRLVLRVFQLGRARGYVGGGGSLPKLSRGLLVLDRRFFSSLGFSGFAAGLGAGLAVDLVLLAFGFSAGASAAFSVAGAAFSVDADFSVAASDAVSPLAGAAVAGVSGAGAGVGAAGCPGVPATGAPGAAASATGAPGAAASATGAPATGTPGAGVGAGGSVTVTSATGSGERIARKAPAPASTMPPNNTRTHVMPPERRFDSRMPDPPRSRSSPPTKVPCDPPGAPRSAASPRNSNTVFEPAISSSLRLPKRGTCALRDGGEGGNGVWCPMD